MHKLLAQQVADSIAWGVIPHLGRPKPCLTGVSGVQLVFVMQLGFALVIASKLKPLPKLVPMPVSTSVADCLVVAAHSRLRWLQKRQERQPEEPHGRSSWGCR